MIMIDMLIPLIVFILVIVYFVVGAGIGFIMLMMDRDKNHRKPTLGVFLLCLFFWPYIIWRLYTGK